MGKYYSIMILKEDVSQFIKMYKATYGEERAMEPRTCGLSSYHGGYVYIEARLKEEDSAAELMDRVQNAVAICKILGIRVL